MPYNTTLFLLHCIENAHIGKWHCMDWHFVWNRKATNRTSLNLPPHLINATHQTPMQRLSATFFFTAVNLVSTSQWMELAARLTVRRNCKGGNWWRLGWSETSLLLFFILIIILYVCHQHMDCQCIMKQLAQWCSSPLCVAVQRGAVRCIATHCSEGGTGGARGRGKTSHLYWSSPGGRLFILLIVIIFVVKIIILIAMIIISHLNSSLLLTSALMTGCLYFTRKSSARFNN